MRKRDGMRARESGKKKTENENEELWKERKDVTEEFRLLIRRCHVCIFDH